MSPERSIYDLFKVVFAKSSVMLKEHFRCVSPIIEYSKREFYNHELRPLRVPRASERLDPPLVDVVVQDGHRKGDVIWGEARFIVDEIKAIVRDPSMAGPLDRVVSLLGRQAGPGHMGRLTDEIGPETHATPSHHLRRCPYVPGKERDIMFLPWCPAPNDVGAAAFPPTSSSVQT